MANREWFRDDELWAGVGPLMFSAKRLAATPAEVDAILELTKTEPPAAVLDLGCGIGRHCIELAKRGFQVTGVDRTVAYLEQARQRATAAGVSVEWVESEMLGFRREGAFDLALSMYTSFSYYENHAENERILSDVCASLRPGGRFIIEMAGKEILARIFQPRGWEEIPGGFLLQEREVSDDWSRMNNRWILVRDGQVREYRLAHWLYAATEFADMLRAAGFSEVSIYGSLEGAPYDREARRLVAVATK